MKWREFVGEHPRALQRWAVAIAIILVTVLAIRLLTPRPSPEQRIPTADDVVRSIRASADTSDALGVVSWPPQPGPDSTSFGLSTRCLRGTLYYKFSAFLDKKTASRFRRTDGQQPRFTIILLDSAGFKLKQIPLFVADLIVDYKSNFGVVSANDTTSIRCRDYLDLKSWDVTWRLVE